MFLLPDGDAGLGFVDDGAAGVEGVAAVRRRHAHPDREFAELEKSGAVHAGGAEDRGARRDFGENAGAFLFREGDVGLILQGLDRLALVVIPHPALELDIGAGAQIQQLTRQCRRIKRDGGDAKRHAGKCLIGRMRLSLRPPEG